MYSILCIYILTAKITEKHTPHKILEWNIFVNNIISLYETGISQQYMF
jgi:hypothetical protein